MKIPGSDNRTHTCKQKGLKYSNHAWNYNSLSLSLEFYFFVGDQIFFYEVTKIVFSF